MYQEFDKLLEELYDHKLLTVSNVKRHIDYRTQEIRNKLKGVFQPPQVKYTKVHIQSTLVQPPHYHIDLDHLPRPVVLNGKPKMYAMDSNPYVQRWANNVGPKRFSEVNNPNVLMKNWAANPEFNYGKDDYRNI